MLVSHQGHDLVVVSMAADDVERLRADGTGRPEDGDAPPTHEKICNAR